MSDFFRFFFFLILVVLIEFYFFQAIKGFSNEFSPKAKKVVFGIEYFLMGFNILIPIIGMFYHPAKWHDWFRYVSSIGFVLLVCKLLGCFVLILDDVYRLLRFVYEFIVNNRVEGEEKSIKISRVKFLSQLAVTFAVVPAVGFMYGIIKGAYKYRIHRAQIKSNKIPKAFNGFKIVQISDIHTGSFFNTNALEKAFKLVMEQGADLIVFTGDLVNNAADETKGFENIYASLSAPHGVYSVLGNHDYGDYISWEPGEKEKNLQRLINIQTTAGWKVLMNEHVALEKEGEKIALLGVENWGGRGRFPRYGKLNLAHANTSNYPFKILLSHDPSHWDVQVTNKYKDIDLTLSGHTHGMQFGIEIPNLKWSPVKYLYRNWAGLYKDGDQYLYVNRGLGFLGFPGRLGIWPEITVLELQSV